MAGFAPCHPRAVLWGPAAALQQCGMARWILREWRETSEIPALLNELNHHSVQGNLPFVLIQLSGLTTETQSSIECVTV